MRGVLRFLPKAPLHFLFRDCGCEDIVLHVYIFVILKRLNIWYLHELNEKQSFGMFLYENIYILYIIYMGCIITRKNHIEKYIQSKDIEDWIYGRTNSATHTTSGNYLRGNFDTYVQIVLRYKFAQMSIIIISGRQPCVNTTWKPAESKVYKTPKYPHVIKDAIHQKTQTSVRAGKSQIEWEDKETW